MCVLLVQSEKAVREGERRSSRHADEPRRSLKEVDEEEGEEEEQEERPAKAQEQRSTKAQEQSQWDIEDDEEGSVAASSKTTPSRGRRVRRAAAAPVEHVPTAAESEQLDKMARFFEQLDNQSMEDVFEVVTLRREPHVLRSPMVSRL
jgi:hypothetical protein